MPLLSKLVSRQYPDSDTWSGVRRLEKLISSLPKVLASTHDNVSSVTLDAFAACLFDTVAQPIDQLDALKARFADWRNHAVSDEKSLKRFNKYFSNFLHERYSAVRAFVRAMWDFALFYKVPLADGECLERDLRRLLGLSVLDRLESTLKYLTCKVSYDMLQDKELGFNEAPACPSWWSERDLPSTHYFPLLDCHRFAHRMYERGFSRSRRYALAWGLLNVKRACAQISMLQVIDNLKSHQRNLSQEAPNLDLNDKWVGRIDRELDRILDECPCLERPVTSSAVPSQSACYDVTRGDGGCMEAVRRRHTLFREEQLDGNVEWFEDVCTYPETQCMSIHPLVQVCTIEDMHETQVCEDLDFAGIDVYEPVEWVLVNYSHELETITSEIHVGMPEYDGRAEKYTGKMFEAISTGWEIVEETPDDFVHVLTHRPGCYRIAGINYKGETTSVESYSLNVLTVDRRDLPVHATVCSVLEPFKVRLITVSDASLQTYCGMAREVIFKSLCQHPQLTLIGGPVTRQHIQKFSRKGDQFYVSVDYKEATDHISMNWTLRVWDKLCEKFNLQQFRDAGRRLLCGNILEYEWDKVDPVAIQRNGQLMGCILSFPILCLLNLAGIRAAKDCDDDDSWSFDDLWKIRHPILVNGDDATWVATHQEYSNWLNCISAIGFIRSPGKNYTSRTFITINSQMWLEQVVGGETYWSYEPFVNLGLLRCQSRVLSDTRADHEAVAQVGVILSEMLRGFRGRSETLGLPWNSDELQEICTCLFIKYNRAKLRNRPWFLPAYMGGMGLPHAFPLSTLTPAQVKYVAYWTHMSNVKKIESQQALLARPQQDLSFMRQAVKRGSLYAAEPFLPSKKVVSTQRDWYCGYKLSLDKKDRENYQSLQENQINLTYKRIFAISQRHNLPIPSCVPSFIVVAANTGSAPKMEVALDTLRPI